MKSVPIPVRVLCPLRTLRSHSSHWIQWPAIFVSTHNPEPTTVASAAVRQFFHLCVVRGTERAQVIEVTRPPPRYNEGTLIEAMQNAWRFVEDEVLRERLKEAKGIGTPATRAEIIGGLKRQEFLVAQGKNIVPTDTGLKLFGVLQQADPALVDHAVVQYDDVDGSVDVEYTFKFCTV